MKIIKINPWEPSELYLKFSKQCKGIKMNDRKKPVYSSTREAINSGNELVYRVLHFPNMEQVHLIAKKQSNHSYIIFLRILEADGSCRVNIPLFESPYFANSLSRLKHISDFLIPLIGKG